MEAIILAGGKAERLGTAAGGHPKALVPVAGRPLAAYQVGLLVAFGVHRVIVVTQAYHIGRAVMLCRHLGLDADGVGDDTVRQFTGPWTISSTREYGACVKAVVDVISGRDPIYLGRHETGVEDALRDG